MSSLLTVAWYIAFFIRQLPDSGHEFFFGSYIFLLDSFLLLGFFVQHRRVMRINIWHAAVTDLERVFVKKVSQWVVFIEVLVDSF